VPWDDFDDQARWPDVEVVLPSVEQYRSCEPYAGPPPTPGVREDIDWSERLRYQFPWGAGRGLPRFRLRLGAFGDRERYRKHLLDLGGLGVRDLCPDGDDLLVLAGPSMALSGPARLYRWHRAAHAETSRLVRGAELTLETELAHGAGEDHAEGIALLAGAPDVRLLVVYDSPAQRRRPTVESVLADRVRIGVPRRP
jgi:hypothetical protein